MREFYRRPPVHLTENLGEHKKDLKGFKLTIVARHNTEALSRLKTMANDHKVTSDLANNIEIKAMKEQVKKLKKILPTAIKSDIVVKRKKIGVLAFCNQVKQCARDMVLYRLHIKTVESDD